jgi:regulator of protease activity HflC (stomatin/prohibitin superfamily)
MAFLIILLAGVAVAGIAWLKVRLARYEAIRDRKKELVLFNGMMKLIVWEPNEALVILRYKHISEIISSGSGGMKFIYPIKGEELRARVPMTLRLITWEDQNILTRESIRVRMKIAVWWKVADVRTYVFNIDSGMHIDDSHREIGILEAAEAWLKTMTESTLRTLVSQMSIALLVSSRATSYLHVESKHDDTRSPLAQPAEGGSPEFIAERLREELAAKLANYGVNVQRVEVQEMSLSPEIQESIDRVWRASLLPAQSEQEARARQIELQATASVLGVDAVALREVMKSMQGASFLGVPAFLETLFARIGPQAGRQSPLLGLAQKAELPQGSEEASNEGHQ